MPWKKLATNLLRANLGELANPYKVLLVVTKQCFSKCRNCHIWQAKPENELRLEEIEKIAERNPFFQWLNLTGGEPTEREDLPEIVAAFRRHCPDLAFVNFATNGLRPERAERMCAEIQKLRPPHFVVTVSVDGPPDVNDHLRGIPGDFERAADTLARLRRLGVKAYAGLTLYPENVARIDETVAALRKTLGEFTHRDLHLNVAHGSGHYFGHDRRPGAEARDTTAAIDAFLRARGFPRSPFDVVERLYLKKAKSFLATGETPIPCSATRSSIYISEHGVVYPCSIWEQPLGSLRDSGYRLAPILEAATAVRERVKRKDCPNCWTPCEAYPSLAAHLR